MKEEDDDCLPLALDEHPRPSMMTAKLDLSAQEASVPLPPATQDMSLSTPYTNITEGPSPHPLPEHFSSDWAQINLQLPRDLSTASLRADYVEVLQKIRSVECTRCREDRGERQHSLCGQVLNGARTWKCKHCVERHLSNCNWMLKCVQYGLGSRPPVQHRRGAQPSPTPSAQANQSTTLQISSHGTPHSSGSSSLSLTSGPRTRGSVRESLNASPEQIISGGPSNPIPSPSHALPSTAPNTAPDAVMSLQALALKVEQNDRIIAALKQEIEQLKHAIGRSNGEEATS
ncbi:hypothetical protein C8Q76DRAFT_803283 [Earliella scabrosa]|nr:hypothetical protein C8Q76DRAFT_803283 [Earliella scabrosa]